MTDLVPPRPLCFIASPFGTKASPTQPGSVVHFDEVWRGLKPILTAAGLEPVRADEELIGGFIHRPMYERLVVAEYVVADLTFSNANVAYEVGIRHGASHGTTLLICAAKHIPQLPFDLKGMRVIPYEVQDDGSLTPPAIEALGKAITERIAAIHRGELPLDNPIVQVTGLGPGSPTSHEKTDVFLLRMRYVSTVTERISDAIALQDTAQAVAQLDAVRAEVLQTPGVVAQLHTVLLALFLGYREKESYAQMVSMYSSFPPELQRTPVAREQLAFAYNRLAEAAAKKGDKAEATKLRAKALEVVQKIPAEERSSETFGILGRIHKGLSDAEDKEGNKAAAQAALSQAIRQYEEGFQLDPRDYYPGVNAVTLRIARGRPEDAAELKHLLPVVRFAVKRAPKPSSLRPAEAYWQEATKLELACAERDWEAAPRHVEALLSLKAEPWMQPWMYGTTLGNLEKQRKARAGEPDTVQHLEEAIQALTQGKS